MKKIFTLFLVIVTLFAMTASALAVDPPPGGRPGTMSIGITGSEK